MAIDRYCMDCNQRRDDTSWSDYYNTRICMDCYNDRSRSEAFECGECEEPTDLHPLKQRGPNT